MVRLEIAALYVGINLLILLFLAGIVISNRWKHKIVLGDGDNAAMRRAVRAHANAAEYMPGALVGLVLLALLEPAAPNWLLHTGGIFLTVGRIFHGVGLNLGARNIGRMMGTILTLASYLIIGGGLIYAALAAQL